MTRRRSPIEQQYLMNGSVSDVTRRHQASTRRTMYLTLVRLHLGYATKVWSPQSIELMKSLERVQRRATKYILMLPFQTKWSYQHRLIQCNLLPISYWHEMMDLVFLYKATIGFIDIDRSILPTIRRSASNKIMPYQ